MKLRRVGGAIGRAAGFAMVYTALLFLLTNFFYWYFTRTFLYAELFDDAGYYMYDWLGNAVATVAMLICCFAIELLRRLPRLKAPSGT